MRNNTSKRISCLIVILAVSLNLCITAFAEERTRIEVIIENETDIIEFLHSGEYDPDSSYSFIIENNIQARILCPKCRNDGYKGYTRHKDGPPRPRGCPDAPDTSADMCDEYYIYTYSFCDYCGYKTPEYYQSTYWIVTCHYELPDGWGVYIAKPGQSINDGYNPHEDPVYMILI